MAEIQPGIYRHYKGGIYEVLDIAKHTETLEELVVYRALYGEMKLWARPSKMWNERVESAAQDRFTYIAHDLEELDSKPRFALIEKIAETMQTNFDEMSHYYHIPSGEVICVQDCHMRAAEDCDEGETFDAVTDYERKSLRQAHHLIWHENEYLTIPEQNGHEEYALMRSFIDETPMPSRSRDMLLVSIQGNGAFRRFKDTLLRADMEHEWYTYRDAAYRAKARDWCNESDIQWGKTLC